MVRHNFWIFFSASSTLILFSISGAISQTDESTEIDRKIHAPEFVRPAPEMKFFFRNWKKYFIFGSMLPKLKLCAPEIKNLLLFRKNWFSFREPAPETEIHCSRIENISPELKMLVLDLGSMLPVSKNAPCMKVTIF